MANGYFSDQCSWLGHFIRYAAHGDRRNGVLIPGASV
jgi:hypothetical protein